jgi:hypothetical protein
MNNLIPVEGRPNLYRDANSGAIINTDNNAYSQHLKNYKRIEEEKNKIDRLESDVESIKNDLFDIKFLLTSLLNKP